LRHAQIFFLEISYIERIIATQLQIDTTPAPPVPFAACRRAAATGACRAIA
jgi:hypothetical protein